MKGNKYHDVVVRYDIPMDKFESNLRLFKGLEKKNAEEQEERTMEQIMMKKQLHMKKKEENKTIKSDCNVLKVKVPKLVITRFNSTCINWFIFWNRFKSEIDRSELSTVSKFSYLKELIFPKVRVTIDGLPFTSEG